MVWNQVPGLCGVGMWDLSDIDHRPLFFRLAHPGKYSRHDVGFHSRFHQRPVDKERNRGESILVPWVAFIKTHPGLEANTWKRQLKNKATVLQPLFRLLISPLYLPLWQYGLSISIDLYHLSIFLWDLIKTAFPGTGRGSTRTAELFPHIRINNLRRRA